MVSTQPNPDRFLKRQVVALDAGNRTTQWIIPTGFSQNLVLIILGNKFKY
ncbi:hypothetical protein [Calothrix sp. PCC 6303]|nr:hypothetical protein [Calothrix sp. PCC 6303]AFZ04621.1 hypothetical protein Cal6303_5756 [Calothrix sp. PCC 6303]